MQPSPPDSSLTIPSDPELDRADELFWDSWEIIDELRDQIIRLEQTDPLFVRKQAELQAAEHRHRRAAEHLVRVRSRSPETHALNTALTGGEVSRSKEKAIRLSSRMTTASRPRARSSRGTAPRTRGSRRTAGGKAPPGDDGGGDPEPPGLKLETGRQTDKSTITSIGGQA